MRKYPVPNPILNPAGPRRIAKLRHPGGNGCCSATLSAQPIGSNLRSPGWLAPMPRLLGKHGPMAGDKNGRGDGHCGIAAEERSAAPQPLEPEAQVAEFLEDAPLGLLWIGPDGRIQRANRAWAELTGGSQASCAGRPFAEFFTDPQAGAELLAATRRNWFAAMAPSGRS